MEWVPSFESEQDRRGAQGTLTVYSQDQKNKNKKVERWAQCCRCTSFSKVNERWRSYKKYKVQTLKITTYKKKNELRYYVPWRNYYKIFINVYSPDNAKYLGDIDIFHYKTYKPNSVCRYLWCICPHSQINGLQSYDDQKLSISDSVRESRAESNGVNCSFLHSKLIERLQYPEKAHLEI